MSSSRGNARIGGNFRAFVRARGAIRAPRAAASSGLGGRISSRASRALVASLLLAGGALASACGGGGRAVKPVASLASSTAAAAAFAPIRSGWATQTQAARRELRAPVEQFLAAFPNDGLTPLVRTYYVFILLDAGDTGRADFFLRSLEVVAPAGATRDLVTIGRAKQLRLLGHPDRAFDLLRPLVGKMVDPASRALFQEEVSLSAIEAHRDYEAIAYMDAWLRNVSEEDRDVVRTKVVAALQKLPDNVLEGSLRAMRARGAASGYGREIQRLVSERLAQIAIERGDPDLARWLLNPEGGAPSLVGSAEGALGELATSRRGISSVEGRRIGLLLPTASNDLRDEAAAVMRGVAWALELPRPNPSAADGTRLSTRDDGGDPERVVSTMSELAGEGASVIVAALDPRSADRAVKWGEEHAMPVLVLAVPAQEQARDYAFVLGEPRANELAALGEALVDRGTTKVAPVVAAGGDPTLPSIASGSLTLLPSIPCDIDPTHAGDARFPLATWRAAHVRAWLVDGPTECARDLIRELALASSPGLVALTLDAAGTTARGADLKLVSVQAGQIPVVASRPDDVSDADLRRYVEHEGVPPSWWTALGRDAALLARRAVAPLPLDATSDGNEVARRRALVKEGIASARARFWTTDADGLGAAHALPRTLQVVDLPSASPRARR